MSAFYVNGNPSENIYRESESNSRLPQEPHHMTTDENVPPTDLNFHFSPVVKDVEPQDAFGDQPPEGVYAAVPEAQIIPRLGSDWSTHLFDIFADGRIAAAVFCCTPCQHAREFNILENEIKGMNMMFCSAEVLVTLLGGSLMTSMATWILRSRIRSRYAIPGTSWHDGLASVFCALCATCQMEREMKIRGDAPGTCFDFDVPSGPRATQGMGHVEAAPCEGVVAQSL